MSSLSAVKVLTAYDKWREFENCSGIFEIVLEISKFSRFQSLASTSVIVLEFSKLFWNFRRKRSTSSSIIKEKCLSVHG